MNDLLWYIKYCVKGIVFFVFLMSVLMLITQVIS